MRLFILSFLTSYILSFPPIAFAVTNPLSPDDNTISATISTSAGTSVSIPHLHSPQNGSVTNNLYQQFSWQRSTGGLMHYTFYFDDLVLADGITHEPSQDKTEWSAVVDSAYVYFTLKTPLPEGIHRWKVIAQGEIDVATSEIWSLTIDATPPVIILQAVDKNNMYWSTNDPSGIPPESERHLTVGTPDPLLVGKVEARSNIKFSHGSQTVTTTEMDGYWEQRFTDLLDSVIYTVYITATDTAGNTNSFPPFTIVYRPGASVTLTPTVTPIPSVIASPTFQAKPDLALPDFRQPPPPPAQPAAPTVSEPAPTPSVIPDLIGNLYPLILFGLLLHLTMTFYGAGIHLGHLPGFLFTLCFPFFGKKTYEVDPFFATVTIFDPENLSKEFFSWVSNIKGKISLEFPNPKQVFVQLTRPGYEKQSLLIATAAIPEGTVLKLKPKDHLTPLERAEAFSLALRGLPLIIADLTSLVVLILQPSIPIAFYFGLALTLTYSEYIYPASLDKVSTFSIIQTP